MNKRFKMKKSITSLIFFISLSVICTAQISWNPTNGPYGGSVARLVHNGSEIFAATSSGIHYSNDNAGNWEKNEYVHMNVIDMECTDDGEVYAACMGNMYYSEDDGITWITINGNLGRGNYKACRTNSQGHLFSITHFSHDYNKIHYTTNNGNMWQRLQVPTELIQVINIDANDYLYIGTYRDGIYRSSDNYEDIDKVGLDTFSLRCISFDDNNYVYGGTQGQGIYRSTNDGDTWEYFGLDGYSIYAFHQDSNGDYYAGTYSHGVFRSTNSGMSWDQLNNGLQYLSITDFMSKGSDIYLSCKGGGVFRLKRDSDTWENHTKGMKNTSISSIRYSDDGTLYVTSNVSGFFYSTNGGLSWVCSGITGVNDIRNMIETSSGSILVGTWYHGIYRSTDKGASWINTYTSDGYCRIGDFSKDASGNIYSSASGSGVLKSTDDGETWESIGLTEINTINAVCVGYEGTIFAATYSNGLYRSTDDGMNWEQMSTSAETGLKLLYIGGQSVMSGGYGGILEKTTNNGNSWIPIYNTIFEITDIVKDSNGNLYLTSSGRGVMLSADNGTNWNFINTGLPDMNVYSITKTDDGALYAGTNDGVYSTEIVDPSLIGIPNLISPTNHSIAISKDTTLEWSIAQGALYYDIEVAEDENFNNIIMRNYNHEGISIQINDLDNNKHYFWHVRAKNDDFVGDWSDIWTFRTGLRKPGLIYPLDNSFSIAREFELKWSVSEEVILSYLQISTDDTFKPDKLLFDGVTDEIDKQKVTLFYDTKYFWRIKVKSQENESRWSDHWCFTTALEAPEQKAPIDGSIVNNIKAEFSWEEVENADKYYLQICLDSLANDIIEDSYCYTNKQTVILNNDNEYYWRVKALNVNNTSTWSDMWKFKTLPVELEAPRLKFPANNSENITTEIELEWHYYPSIDTDSIRIQVSESHDFSEFITDITIDYTLTFAISDLEYSRKYFWRIKAIVGNRESPWSDIWSFSTEPKVLTSPLLILPENNSELQQSVLHFQWTRVEETESYYIQIAEDNNFAKIVKENDNVANNMMIYDGFKKEKTYYWRVKATSNDSESPWSEIWNFIIKEPTSDISDNTLVSGLKVYPNPVDDFIMIELPTGILGENHEMASVELFDLNSRSIFKENISLSKMNTIIDIKEADIPSGVIVMKLKIAKQIFFCKIIKK